MSPIQTGCAATPMSTNTIAARSSSDRGRTAERIPIGSEIASQKIAPPKTSDAVTGAVRAITSFTSSRLTNDSPSDLVDDELLQEEAVLHPQRIVQMELVGDVLHLLGRGALAGRETRRVGGCDEEDDVRDDRDREEQEHGPEQASDEVAAQES